LDVPLIVESAQVFDTHHVALLIAAGATAVVPYLRTSSPSRLSLRRGKDAHRNERRPAQSSCRMGVSTLASYRNSHLFEVVGSPKSCAPIFSRTPLTFPGQKSLDNLLTDYLSRHQAAFSGDADDLSDAGLYRFERAPNFMPVRRKSCAVFTLTYARPTPKNIPRLKNWRSHQARSSCVIFAGHRSRTAGRSPKSTARIHRQPLSAPRRCRWVL